jgi:hypothetical protein
MTDRRLWQRLSKIDKRIASARKKANEKAKQRILWLRSHARHHATAVAAVVLSGEPTIDEPLSAAWNRALQHYRIKFTAGGGMNAEVRAAEELGPAIMDGKEPSARFAEIFAAAPIWLMQFTGLAMDARLLGFQLPDISRKRFNWGSAGYEDARRWPLLPSGTMMAGDPIPNIDPRHLWLAYFCILTVGDPIQAVQNGLLSVREEEMVSSTGDPLVDEINWGLGFLLDDKPEEDWLPHEKRRMRKLRERTSLFEEFFQPARTSAYS